MRCRACGTEGEPGESFCGHCGAALHDAATAHPRAPEGTRGREAERRHLTVMFCDLVGSTELASRMDPEEWRHVVHGYQRCAADTVARFGGHVAEYLGDGLLVYFGWPQAHDDDAERAVRAGLDLVDAVPAHDTRLAVRVGIHSGLTIVGEREVDGSIEAVGDALNVAARVQALAETGTVVVTEATHRLVSGLFVVESHGPQALKGVPDPVALYRVVRPSGARSRVAAAAAARGLTPFVDREDERRLLRGRFEQARTGNGQVVLIDGEPGIGKSRIVHVLRDDVRDATHMWIETGGASYFANTPFYAVTELLGQLFPSRPDDEPEHRSEALERSLAAAGLDVREALPLVAPVINLPVPAHDPPRLEASEVTRGRLLATLASWVLGAARLQPLVVLLEDLHWVDPSTLGLLQLLVEQGAEAPLLLLFTARPEFEAPWPVRAHHTVVSLRRLDRGRTRELVDRVAPRTVLRTDVVEALLARADGVPLFVEELTRAVVERRADEVPDIPATLHDSLMARLDRLGQATKEIAQVGAVLGREFPYELLHAVHPCPAAELEEGLGRLVDAELLYARGATYLFKHALVQDAAYRSLLKSRRRVLHGRVAQEILRRFPDVAQTRPELLAHHHTEAGEMEAAAAAWQRAGERALKHGAMGEAVSHFGRGIDVLKVLPESRSRDEQEFRLQRQLGRALTVTKGYSSREYAEANARAHALEAKLPDAGESALILVSLSMGTLSSEGAAAAQPKANDALQAAERAGFHRGLVWAHFAQGVVRYHSADLAGAREHLARAIALCDEAAVASIPFDPRIGALGFAALTAWHLGLIEEARRHARDGLDSAERSGRPADRAWAARFAATLHQFMREPGEARLHAERALAACSDEPNVVEEALATAVLGWAIGAEGDASRGIATLRDGMERTLGTGMRLLLAHHLALLGDLQSRTNDVAGALETLAEAERTLPREEVTRAELLRLRADLLAREGNAPSTVEAAFRAALETARRQAARIYELRTGTSFARFLCRQGRHAEARDVLAPVYASFTDGFDTRDLIDAKALLDELGQ